MTRSTLYKSATAALAAALCACALALAGCAEGQSAPPATAATTAQAAEVGQAGGEANVPTITVTASSEVKVVPDKATITLAVVTQATTAQATQAANSEGCNAVIDALKGLGIAEESIQTASTYLSPRYDYSSPAVYGDDGSNIVGYEMNTRLAVSNLEIDQVGEVLQTALDAGANGSEGVQYYSSVYDERYQEALGKAVEAANAKANVLAGAAGSSVKGIVSIVEGYQNTAVRYESMDYAMAAEVAGSAMKVMPGELDVAASVTVTYDVS